MIIIKTIASGSTGNCYRIDNGKDVLMIECGIRFKEIRKAFDFKLSQVAGCLISHGHDDHSKSVNELTRSGIDCFMTQGTLISSGAENSHRIKIVRPGGQFKAGSYTVVPFPTQHDDIEPVGFLIQSGKDKLLFATDTYYIRHRFKGLNYIMVECNYKREYLIENLKAGTIAKPLYDRVIESHFELENVKEFLKANDLSQVREIHLIHISENNGYPEFFKDEIEKFCGIPTYV